MIKYRLIFILILSVILLGLSRPGATLDPRRDPVPSTQKVAHSSHCAGCHGIDGTGKALVDGNGNDVSIHDDWQISMMGLSAHDPFWRATLAHEVSVYPNAKSEIETTCLKCHAPLGSIEAHLHGRPYSYELMLADSLGLDGVSCSSCHQQPASNLGSGHSGNFKIDTNRLIFGPYPNPFQGPMQIYVGFDPVFSDHIYLSGLCAGCHTLITETLNTDGSPSGSFFVEQATYHEWLNSVYPAQGKECQTCHMPFIADSVIIAIDFQALKKRYPFGLHQFFGANTAMLQLMNEHQVELNLPQATSDHAWNESIQNNRKSLESAASVTVSSMLLLNDTLTIDLTIQNKTGHKLPSGYPSRLAWIQITLIDQFTKAVIYMNGQLDSEGNIVGRDHPFEPHHQVMKSADDVQIYEMVMGDVSGQLTTRLNAAYRPLKDNRLLPVGFKTNHQVYDTVAIWGNALQDPDYNNSSLGQDKMKYQIPLQGHAGLADLKISFRYQSIPSRWMNDLFQHDSIAQVAQFKSMYEGYEAADEVMNQLEISSIDLSSTSTRPSPTVALFNIFPNPSNGSIIYVSFEHRKVPSDQVRYEIVDPQGRRLQSGKHIQSIVLSPNIKKGVFYLFLYQDQQLLAVKPFTVL